MKKAVPLAAGALLLAAVVYFVARPSSGPGRWVEGSGVLEATQVDVSAQVGGQLAEVVVSEGEPVNAGQVLAELEREEIEAQLQQAEGAVRAAEGDLARAEAAREGARLTRDNARTTFEKRTELKGRYETAVAQHQAVAAARDQAAASLRLVREGARAEQIRQAEAALKSARAEWGNASRELRRLEKLLAEGAVSERQVDIQRSAEEASRGRRDAADARLAELRAGARIEEERQAAAALAQAEANLQAAERSLETAREVYEDRIELKQRLDAAEAEYRAAQEATQAAEGRLENARGARRGAQEMLRDATVRAPMDGVVLLKIREPGETVGPGQPVVRLADLEHMWLRVYLPQTELDRVKLGRSAEVITDAEPDRVHAGVVSEIGQEAQFAPKNVQTKEQRVQLVFPVKVSVDNPDRSLKPGMPADARIDARGSAGDE